VCSSDLGQFSSPEPHYFVGRGEGDEN